MDKGCQFLLGYIFGNFGNFDNLFGWIWFWQLINLVNFLELSVAKVDEVDIFYA